MDMFGLIILKRVTPKENVCFESKIRIKGLIESPGAAPTRKTCAEEKEEGIAAKSCALRCKTVMAVDDE